MSLFRDTNDRTRPQRHAMRALVPLAAVCGLLLALLMTSSAPVGRFLFGGSYLVKSQFAARDLQLLEQVLAVPIPRSAVIELATFGGPSRDHELTVRMRLPGADLPDFEKALRAHSSAPAMAFLGQLQSTAEPWTTSTMEPHRAFQVGDARQFILVAPQDSLAVVYFEAYAAADPRVAAISAALFADDPR